MVNARIHKKQLLEIELLQRMLEPAKESMRIVVTRNESRLQLIQSARSPSTSPSRVTPVYKSTHEDLKSYIKAKKKRIAYGTISSKPYESVFTHE
jgi:hypothetical protein